MTGYLWAVAVFVGGIGMTAMGDMVSEEVRDRLDHVPHAILRLAARRLDPERRLATYEEVWLPDLAYLLKGDEARPVTRLVHGTRFAVGILASAHRSSRNLDRSAQESRVEVLVDTNVILRFATSEELIESLRSIVSQTAQQKKTHAWVMLRMGRARTRGGVLSGLRHTLLDQQRQEIEASLAQLYFEREIVEKEIIRGDLENFLKRIDDFSRPARRHWRSFWPE